MIKHKDISNFNDLKEYVNEMNILFSIMLFLLVIFVLVLILFSLKWSEIITLLISIVLGLFGTFLLGITAIYSSKEIIQLSSMHLDFDKDKAKSILFTKLLSGIGTILLLTGLVMQSISIWM